MGTDLVDLHVALADHLERIKLLFKRGSKITVVVRNPAHGDQAGLVIGDDDLDEAIAEIRRRQDQLKNQI